jgi:hypothetical protein
VALAVGGLAGLAATGLIAGTTPALRRFAVPASRSRREPSGTPCRRNLGPGGATARPVRRSRGSTARPPDAAHDVTPSA